MKIKHYPNCTADYPEKPPGEAPQATVDVDIGGGEVVRQCVDCGVFIILQKSELLIGRLLP